MWKGVSYKLVTKIDGRKIEEYDREQPATNGVYVICDAHYYFPNLSVSKTAYMAGMEFSNLNGAHVLPCCEGVVRVYDADIGQMVTMTSNQNEKGKYEHGNVYVPHIPMH